MILTCGWWGMGCCVDIYEPYTLMKIDTSQSVLWVADSGATAGSLALNSVELVVSGLPSKIQRRNLDGVLNYTFTTTGGTIQNNGLAIDASGNILTGHTATNAGANKPLEMFDSSGAPLWTKRFFDPLFDLGGNGSVFSVALDSGGNLYACGFQEDGTFARLNGCVQKYDSSGTFLWRYFPSGTLSGGFFLDLGTPPVLATNSTTVTTGGQNARQSSGSFDTILQQVSSAGVAAWTTLPAATANTEFITALAYFSDGSVAVTSYSTVASMGYTRKYNTGGALLWSVDHGNARVNCVAIDSSNNVYIGGQQVVDSITGAYVSVRKYDSSGSLLWNFDYFLGVNHIGVITTSGDSVRGIAIDSSGNVYMCGTRVVP